MSLSNDFKNYCEIISFEISKEMKASIQEITKKLNKELYDLNDSHKHIHIVGSIGRGTAINSHSDIDLLFELPKEIFSKYDKSMNNGQSKLLQDIKRILISRYPNTDLRGDGQVVVINFSKYKVELVPVFKNKDNTFKYPDSHNGGSWKITNPVLEQEECQKAALKYKNVYIDFCHIIREWKIYNDLHLGGLLIDTLIYNILCEKEYDLSYDNYLTILMDIFYYIGHINKNRKECLALGSNQIVYFPNDNKFIEEANKSFNKIKEAMLKGYDLNRVLRKILGCKFPISYDNTEEFIEDKYTIDLKYNLDIICKVSNSLNSLFKLKNHHNKSINKGRTLKFYFKTNCPSPYQIFWKICNQGEEAKKRNCIRGQILKGNHIQTEYSNFNGNHFVECYLIKDNICVARSRIDIPIR